MSNKKAQFSAADLDRLAKLMTRIELFIADETAAGMTPIHIAAGLMEFSRQQAAVHFNNPGLAAAWQCQYIADNLRKDFGD